MGVNLLLFLFLGGVDMDLSVALAEVVAIVCGGCIDLAALLLSDKEESESLDDEEDDDEDPDDDEESEEDDDEDDLLKPAAT
mmetsp:Transcript_9192/g.18476  ORF Transcript_9192/g.18476 Transcript_9192/m.18476 type:complete len:82 (+) Transcript_9192:2984-3229(+)